MEHSFSEFVWSKSNLVAPNGNSYRLYQLQVELEPTATPDGAASYIVRFSRTGNVLCYMKVRPDERESLRHLQNAVILSKLDARLD